MIVCQLKTLFIGSHRSYYLQNCIIVLNNMKQIISTFLTVMTVILMSNSCTPDITPVNPGDNNSTEIGNGGGHNGGEEPGTEPNPEPDPEPNPEPDPNPNPGPEPDPEVVFELVSQRTREIRYNGCNICGRVKTNVGLIVEIPQDCDWIKPFDGYNNTSNPGIFGLTIGSLPETTDHCQHGILFDWCCSGEDRECVITLWDTGRTRHLEMTVKQQCYGCSYGTEQGSDIIEEF